MTDDEIKAALARCKTATPGPWGVVRPCPMVPDRGNATTGVAPLFVAALDGHEMTRCYGPVSTDADAIFIAHARTDLPAALADLVVARKENARLRGELAQILAERDGAVSIATQAERTLARMRDVLRAVEWGTGSLCPDCAGWRPGSRTGLADGHAADCRLAAVLGGTT